MPMTEEYIRMVFEAARGSVIMTSCDTGQLSFPWAEKKTSVFTHYLLDGLQDQTQINETGFIAVDGLKRCLVEGVRTWAIDNNREQTPRFENLTDGDIIIADWRPVVDKPALREKT
jgi:hypothetical protein